MNINHLDNLTKNELIFTIKATYPVCLFSKHHAQLITQIIIIA